MKWFWLSLFFSFLLDRITKLWIYNNIFLPVKVSFFLNIVKVWNSGIVWGFGNKNENFSRLLFLLNLFLLVLLFLYVFYFNKRERKFKKKQLVFLGFILGGGLGNLVDRILWGKVLDFLDFHYKNLHWPAFNLADAFITTGIFGLLFINLFSYKNQLTKQPI